jgi:hypothetical protein
MTVPTSATLTAAAVKVTFDLRRFPDEVVELHSGDESTIKYSDSLRPPRLDRAPLANVALTLSDLAIACADLPNGDVHEMAAVLHTAEPTVVRITYASPLV